MEFNEKLHELRKNRGLTQEELAEALFVSRTAISKWESGRGYPSIDSLKEISSFLDIFSFLLIVLPLYPRHIGNYVSAVSLFGYSETTVFNRNIYWGIFTALMILGVIKIVMLQLKAVKGKKVLQISSMVINIVAVMFLALARETYATVLIFLLFLMKGILAAKGRVLDI